MSANKGPEGPNREQKRAQFTEPARAGRRSKILPVAVVTAFLAAFAAIMVSSSSKDAPSPAAVPPAQSGGDIRIPLGDVSGKARFFDYALPNKRPVRFFVIKSSDGVYRAALDACDVCYHARKGYSQEGDDMVCNNCGMHFHSALINEVSGGCNPVGLSRTIEGEHLIIRASELEQGGKYF